MSDRRLIRHQGVPSGLPTVVLVTVLFAVGGRTLLAYYGSPATANRWVLVAIPILGYQVGFLGYQQITLGQPDGHLRRQPLPTIITMVRGHLYAATAGFLLVSPTPLLAWIPGLCYGLGATLDWVDGRVARAIGGTSRLGARLDLAFDTLGFLVAPLVGVVWGRLPLVYLSLSAARYLFRGGTWWRRRRGRPVGDLSPSRLRRWLAALQMAFITVALLPVLPTTVVHPAAVVVLVPSLAMFTWDYLEVTGRLGTGLWP